MKTFNIIGFNLLYHFVWESKFRFHIEEWGEPVRYVLLFLKTEVYLIMLFKIPVVWANFSSCYWNYFLFSWEILQPRHLKFFTYCRHLLSAMILYLTGSFSTSSINSDFAGDISTTKHFAIFCNVNYPLHLLLWLNRLQQEEYLFFSRR